MCCIWLAACALTITMLSLQCRSMRSFLCSSRTPPIPLPLRQHPHVQVPYGAHGYGSFFTFATLDHHFREGMSLDQAKDVLKKCFLEVRTMKEKGRDKELAVPVPLPACLPVSACLSVCRSPANTAPLPSPLALWCCDVPPRSKHGF